MTALANGQTFAVIIVMGVCGCGKSTLGMALADLLGWAYVEGDDRHPPCNIDAMSRGLPLTDEMRLPWLAAIAGEIDYYRQQRSGVVVSCSALRRSYRETLSAGRDDVMFIHLDLDAETLSARMASRQGHFMPPSLLDSQLKTLEPLAADERGIAFQSGVSAVDCIKLMHRKFAIMGSA
ncbi:MAG: gluconokinase [Hoeflea sp.]|uniref:gluconokinase n=1 Tax=Hoeflea sp. TaxID=1940281 RepID=UPI0032995552